MTYLLTLAGTTAAGWFFTRPVTAALALTLGFGMGVVLVGSDVLYRTLKARLGRLTSFAALCLAWAGLWTALAASSSTCMTSTRTTACTGSELWQWSLVGLLFPLIVPAVAVGPWLTYRGIRWAAARFRPRSTP